MKRSLLNFLLFLGSAAFYLWIVSLSPRWWDGHFTLGTGTPAAVRIPTGVNARQAAEEFAAAGVVEQGRGGELARWMGRFSIDRRLRPGVYSVKKGTPWEVARQLETAEPVFAAATILPGADKFSLGEMLSAPPLTEKALEELLLRDDLYPGKMIPLLPETAEGRIAFLLPETFHLPEKSGKETIGAAAELWWKKFAPLISKEEDGKSRLKNLSVLASLVEREALWDDERPLVAGVIENRLRKKMLLQVDATVVYAWKLQGRNLTRVLNKDLEIESPYNTYIVSGLPPEPICVPSEESWRAAFAPRETEYLYYVAGPDGRHLFSKTYSGHLRNIRTVRGK